MLSLHERKIIAQYRWQDTDTYYIRQMMQQSGILKNRDVAGYSGKADTTLRQDRREEPF